MPILQADGTPYHGLDTPTILTAEGEAYQPPAILNAVEMEVLSRAFGLNKRNRIAHKNEYRLGILPPTHPLIVLCNDLQRRGIVRLLGDARGLSKKALKKLKAGDLSQAAQVVQVTRYGGECFKATVRDSENRMRAAMMAEKQ